MGTARRNVDPEVARHRARLASAVRDGNTAVAAEERRAMNAALDAAKTARLIDQLVESWPPPTPEQAERLSALLKPKPKTRK